MNLTLLFFIPTLAILHLLKTKATQPSQLKQVALGWSLAQCLGFSGLWCQSTSLTTFQSLYVVRWFQGWGLFSEWGPTLFTYDGMSLLFLGLSALLIPICILISWNVIDKFQKEFLICLFVVLLLLVGVFSMMDLLGFYILFETLLIPMFLIIGMWGSREEKVKAAYYFFFYTLVGSLLMLISIFKIYALTGTTHYHVLLHIEFPPHLQYWLFLGFFLSLAVKMPMFPTHIWLPQAHVEAPIAGSVLLAGILLKLGGYGFIRFSYPLFPLASEFFTPSMITLSLIAIVYGAFTTCRQTDIKRLIAYSSVSHMGLVTLAIFVHSLEGLLASLLMMLAHGLVSSGLFMTSACLYTSHHSSAIKYFKGLAVSMPLFASVTFFLVLGNMSFPGTLNFIAEFSSLLASTQYSLGCGLVVCIGILLGTVYSLYMYNSMYFGTLSPFLGCVSDITAYEFNSFMPLLGFTLIFGVFPNTLILSTLLSSTVALSL